MKLELQANDAPGLIAREVILTCETHAIIRETWDLTEPGCPIVAYHFDPAMRRDDGAVVAVITKHEAVNK